MPSLLSADVRDLEFTYASAAGVFRLALPSLNLRCGELVALYGPNGCGKTTLLRLIVGALRPQAGRIAWSRDGKSLRLRIGEHVVLTNGASPFPHLTVEENIRYVSNGAVRNHQGNLERVLDEWGLRELRNRLPREVSAGQAQRVILARALAVDAGAYLLDEIESAQSEIWAQRVGEGLRRLTDEGRMVIVISHDQTWIANHCARVVELGADGRPGHDVSDVEGNLRASTFGVLYDGPVSAWPRLAVLAGRWSAPAQVMGPR